MTSRYDVIQGVTCLITGVVLREVEEGRSWYADLFRTFDGSWIVNATGAGDIVALDEMQRVVSFSSYKSAYFCRRNVFVFPRSSLLLNKAALDYIKKAPYAPT